MKTNFTNPHQKLAFVDESRIDEIDYKNPELKPRVSVVVPIFNAEYTLDEALASIEAQTMRDLEIICVVDAATDDSAQIVQAHAARDDRYVVLTHTKNSGYGASMNDGIAASRGEWVAILEPDDYILPSMYETLLSAPEKFEVFPQLVDVIKSPYIREVREEGTRRGDAPKELLNCSYHGRIKPQRQPFTMADLRVSHLLRHHPSIWSALYSKAFLELENIRFVEYPGSGWADNEFFYETLLRARSILYVDEPFYVYREETEREFHMFAQREKMLRFDRWQAMSDIIDSLGIEDDCIRASHIAKGFTYLGEQFAAWGENDVSIRRGMYEMFARMDPRLVAREPMISPYLKQLYFQTQGKDHNALQEQAGYYAGLANELLYTLRNNGKEYTVKQIRRVLSR